jgi:hypothetical protein
VLDSRADILAVRPLTAVGDETALEELSDELTAAGVASDLDDHKALRAELAGAAQ